MLNNRATWLMVDAFENTHDKVYTDYILCDTTKDLQKVFMKYVGFMEFGQELLDLREEIDWQEIIESIE